MKGTLKTILLCFFGIESLIVKLSSTLSFPNFSILWQPKNGCGQFKKFSKSSSATVKNVLWKWNLMLNTFMAFCYFQFTEFSLFSRKMEYANPLRDSILKVYYLCYLYYVWHMCGLELSHLEMWIAISF